MGAPPAAAVIPSIDLNEAGNVSMAWTLRL